MNNNKRVIFLFAVLVITSFCIIPSINTNNNIDAPPVLEDTIPDMAQIETVALKPEAPDVENQWNDWGTTPHYLYVDEDPDNPDQQYVIENQVSNLYERYNFETTDIGSGTVTQIRVRIRSFNLGTATPQVNLYFDGAYQGWKDIISDFNAAYDYTWTGLSGDQADLDVLQVRFKSSLGTGMVKCNSIWAVEVYAYYEYQSQSPQIITPENIDYSEPMEGYYPATYGFENEPHGETGLNITFLDEYGGDNPLYESYYDMRVYDGPYEGHNKVLNVRDSQGGARTWGVHHFDNPPQEGTIEFWLHMNDGSGGSAERRQQIHFRNSNDDIAFRARLRLMTAKLELYVNMWPFSGFYEFADCEDETWYHHSIEFDCATDTFSWIITAENGVTVASLADIPFENDMTTLDEIYITTTTSDYRGNSKWDAFGFSWEDYNVGDNSKEGLLLDIEPDDYTSMSYSLDAQPYVSILGDTVIPMPDLGQHTIQVNGDGHLSELRTFTIIPPTIEIYSPEEGQVYGTGIYPASYSFDGDVIGEEPSGWTITSPSYTEAIVIEEKGVHKTVVQITDTNSANSLKMIQFFPDKYEGYVEFFVRLTWYERFYIRIGDDTIDDAIRIYFDYDPWTGSRVYAHCNDGTHYLMFYKTDIWYHFKIFFNCFSGWSIYADDEFKGAFDFIGDPQYMNFIEFSTPGAAGPGEYFLDAIGYYWDPGYNTGDNRCPGLIVDYAPTDLDSLNYILDGDLYPAIFPTYSGVTYIPNIGYGDHIIQLVGEKAGIEYESNDVSFTCEEGVQPNGTYFIIRGELVSGDIEAVYWPDLSYFSVIDEKLFIGTWRHLHVIRFYAEPDSYSKMRLKWFYTDSGVKATVSILYDGELPRYPQIEQGDNEIILIPNKVLICITIMVDEPVFILEEDKFLDIDFLTFYPV